MPGLTQIDVNGYTVDDNIFSSDDLFDMSAGATFVLLGLDSLTDDSFEGPGLARARGEITIYGALTLTDSATFVNAFAVFQNSGALNLNGSTIRNLSGWTFDSSYSYYPAISASAGSQIVNLGEFQENGGELSLNNSTMRNLGNGTWTLSDNAEISASGSSQFVNLGELDETGDSSINGSFYDREGTLEIDGVLQINFYGSPSITDRFTNDTITGIGDFELFYGVLNGATVSTETTFLQNVRIAGNVGIFSGDVTLDDLSLGAGSDLSLRIEGANVTLADQISGGGEIDILGDDSVSGPATLVGAVTLENMGNSTFNGNSSLSTKPWTGHEVTIENNTAATWTSTGSNSVFEQSAGAAGSSVFINNGTFVDSGGVTFDIAVMNDDVMQVNSPNLEHALNSTLVFNNSINGTGQIDVGPGGVWFDDAVGSGQIVNLDYTPGSIEPTLTIANPNLFAGTIAGFDQSGADEQMLFGTSTWTYQDYVAGNGGGALMFTNGSSEAAVDLSGSYDPSGFHASVIGAKTIITYST